MKSCQNILCRHNPFCGHNPSSGDKSCCCDKGKDKSHKTTLQPIGQACQTRREISEFLRTSIIGSIIGFTTTAEPFTPIFVELRSFDAVTGQVIVNERAMGNFTINLSSICSVKTVCSVTTPRIFNV
ncbi:hypothetical protein J7J00_18090 [Bacillus sp. ISL-4]|uniref:hypothetical protein n=1 Tax=Bacillus sp. ISL-4 TaxID=2819125 RepID=UPI001BED1C74|nr:hypothetical protein [Bacillus sp. ISL-4]MBT2667390.1 hypothetical protein [Bacillus sp. ISL-4]MBT2673055.1 hypothetical protein [Streptomyces sp. ISL-14]